MLLRVNQSTEIFKVWKTENSSESVVRMWGNRDKDNGRINQRKINYIDNNYLVSLIRTLAHYQFRTHILLLTLMKEKKKTQNKTYDAQSITMDTENSFFCLSGTNSLRLYYLQILLFYSKSFHKFLMTSFKTIF